MELDDISGEGEVESYYIVYFYTLLTPFYNIGRNVCILMISRVRRSCRVGPNPPVEDN